MDKFEEITEKQTRNEMEGYKKDRIFYELDLAQELVNDISFELNGKNYVGFTRDMVEEIVKIREEKYRRKQQQEEKER